MAFIVTATISSVVGGVGNYLGAKEQADAARDAANTSAGIQRYMFDQSREDMEPWRQTGQGALYKMSDLMGMPVEGQEKSPQYGSFMDYFGAEDFQKDPGYDFRLAEGQKAIDRSAASRGNLFSGATGKALTQYGQDYGSNEFMNAYNRWNQDRERQYNRLAGLSGTGQTSAQQIGQCGMNTGQNIGNAYQTGIQNAGAARASGYAGVANAVNSGINNYMGYNMMNNMSKMPSYGAPPPGAEYNQGMPYYTPNGWGG